MFIQCNYQILFFSNMCLILMFHFGGFNFIPNFGTFASAGLGFLGVGPWRSVGFYHDQKIHLLTWYTVIQSEQKFFDVICWFNPSTSINLLLFSRSVSQILVRGSPSRPVVQRTCWKILPLWSDTSWNQGLAPSQTAHSWTTGAWSS